MKIQLLVALITVSLSCFSFAETTTSTSTNNDLKPLSGVRISMQRMLKSTNDQYFLSLYAGVPNPKAVLTVLANSDSISFKGTQKGNEIVLSPTESQGQLEQVKKITGVLDANSGIFKSNLSIDQDQQAIEFQPAFKVANKPLFTFKFYGVKADTPTQEQLLTRVDVINKTNNTVAQTLTGFSAFPNSIGYMDINFDGYYDVILSDLSQDRKLQDRRYIYWMFNPKTGQFQRSPQMEKLVGLPKLHGETKQIDYGDGVIFQVENGLLNRLDQ